jgi:hypothetical protein
VLRTISNDAEGRPIVLERGLPTVGEVGFADGTTREVVVNADGAFAFDREVTGRYRLALPSAGTVFELQSEAEALAIARAELGRRDPTEVPETAVLAFPDYVPSAGTPAFASTGIWTTATFEVATQTTTWARATPLATAQLGLLDGEQGDRLYFTSTADVVDAGFNGYRALTHATELAVTMDGGNQPLSGTPLPLPRDRCTTIVPRVIDESARLRAAYPGFTDRLAFWSIDALPRPELGYIGAHTVASRLDIPFPELPDKTIVAEIANPFAGTTVYAQAQLLLGRDLTHPDAALTTLAPLGSTRFAEITRNACEAAELPVPPLVTGFTIAGTPLTTDFETVALPGTRELEVAFAVNGASDMYELAVYELVKEDQSSVLVKLRAIVTAEPFARLPAELFTSGRYFGLAVTAFTGFPEAHTGDFVTRASSGATMFFSSTAFQVN